MVREDRAGRRTPSALDAMVAPAAVARSVGGAVIVSLTLAFVGGLLVPRAAGAQVPTAGTWFPRDRYFQPLVADPREVRLAAGIAATDLFDLHGVPRERPSFAFLDPAEMKRDVQGLVALGGMLPLWRAGEREGAGILLGVQAGVFARFRIEEPSRDYAASDWIVALPVELAHDVWSARFRLVHRSAHLGDELIEETGARRIEFGHEALELLAARRFAGTGRFYGGGSWIFRSNTEAEVLLRERELRDDAAVQLGADGSWYRWADGQVGIVAGIDWHRAQRTGWRSQISGVAGIAARGPGGGLRLLLRYFDGPSAVGEFFLTRESFWAIEIVADRWTAGPRPDPEPVPTRPVGDGSRTAGR